jgi:hypothetical protein
MVRTGPPRHRRGPATPLNLARLDAATPQPHHQHGQAVSTVRTGMPCRAQDARGALFRTGPIGRGGAPRRCAQGRKKRAPRQPQKKISRRREVRTPANFGANRCEKPRNLGPFGANLVPSFSRFSCLFLFLDVSPCRDEKARRAFIHAGLRAFQSGDPNGIRTRVTAVKGRCPRPLDDRVFVNGVSCLMWWVDARQKGGIFGLVAGPGGVGGCGDEGQVF